MKKTLGGDRLGAGKKLQVDLHGYERSTHDLGYLWRSTMSAGTLVPFLSEVALPGDTFDINLDCDIKTHPTIGPLFGSFKVQLDVFLAPIRLYQAQLHNNKLGIGMNMSQIKLPRMLLNANHPDPDNPETIDLDNAQINPSCILPYLGIRGVGIGINPTGSSFGRYFNAVPLLAYWEIYKNYYANKQEELGAVIHNTLTINQTVTAFDVVKSSGTTALPQNTPGAGIELDASAEFIITYLGAAPDVWAIYVNSQMHGDVPLGQIGFNWIDSGTQITGQWLDWDTGIPDILFNWRYPSASDNFPLSPTVATFPLENIDTMRDKVLQNTPIGTALLINDTLLTPYTWIVGASGGINYMQQTQEGLAIKTYQSDLFNNWLNTEWIDGAGGIAEITAVDTSSGEFQIDTLVLAKKVYDMLNKIAVSGGSYDDWIDAVYTHDRYLRAESPMYQGGLTKELVFQEVVSNTSAEGGTQPLGTLAGKGILSKKHKGGYVHVKVDEPSYIIGIVSLTPRIDYSQGNRWDVSLTDMDDFHKPALDEIGFQELITEQMAWWDTQIDSGTGEVIQHSAGKQPAWINYMTNYNRVYGNFAIESNEMFMTLNRKYEPEWTNNTPRIGDLTTYIDPVKFNQIFAQTNLDAMNFWAQIAVDITARRKMSAKVMPNL